MKRYSVQELEDMWIRFIVDSGKRESYEIEIEDFFYYLYELENRDSDETTVPGES